MNTLDAEVGQRRIGCEEAGVNYITQITAVNIRPADEPIFSEPATNVEIDDDGAGQFVVIRQDDQRIRIDGDVWPIIKETVDKMVKTCTA